MKPEILVPLTDLPENFEERACRSGLSYSTRLIDGVPLVNIKLEWLNNAKYDTDVPFFTKVRDLFVTEQAPVGIPT